ncbi:MAG: hypothetical protein ABIP44_07895 [Pseudoxanthomonas sp.]
MGRTILGAVTGLVVAFITIMLVEFASHQAYPPPPDLDPMITEDMVQIMASMPLGAMLLVALAWLIGAFDGGLVAAMVAGRNRPRIAAVVPALMVMAGVLGMIVTMPQHPLWMSVVGLLLPIPMALAGAALATRIRPATKA